MPVFMLGVRARHGGCCRHRNDGALVRCSHTGGLMHACGLSTTRRPRLTAYRRDGDFAGAYAQLLIAACRVDMILDVRQV